MTAPQSPFSVPEIPSTARNSFHSQTDVIQYNQSIFQVFGQVDVNHVRLIWILHLLFPAYPPHSEMGQIGPGSAGIFYVTQLL